MLRREVEGPAGRGQASRRRDAGLLVRVAGQTMTDGGSLGSWALPTALPALLTAVVENDRADLATALSELLGFSGPLCPGYRPKCAPSHTFEPAVVNTVLCRDVAPFTTVREPRAALGVGFREAYGQSWWWDACEQWPVPPADPALREPVESDIPVLILIAGLAPRAPSSVLEAATAGLPNATVVTVPASPDNVLGSTCGQGVRNSWIANPRPLTNLPKCLDQGLDW